MDAVEDSAVESAPAAASPRVEIAGGRHCSKCGAWRARYEFHRNGRRDGTYLACKFCESARRRKPMGKCIICGIPARYNGKPNNTCKGPCREIHKKEQRRRQCLESKYGISLEEFDRLVVAAGGRCQICGTDNPMAKGRGNWSVDHNHKTGKVRGILCIRCNSGMGNLGDSIERMTRAINYLIAAGEV